MSYAHGNPDHRATHAHAFKLSPSQIKRNGGMTYELILTNGPGMTLPEQVRTVYLLNRAECRKFAKLSRLICHNF